MTKIKEIGPLSCAKIFGVLYGLMGLIFGAIMSLFSLVSSIALLDMPRMFGVLFGIGAIIFLPLLYGVLGFISGLIMAYLYNIIASWVGGLEIKISK